MYYYGAIEELDLYLQKKFMWNNKQYTTFLLLVWKTFCLYDQENSHFGLSQVSIGLVLL